MCLKNVKIEDHKKHTFGYKILTKLDQFQTIKNGKPAKCKTFFKTPIQHTPMPFNKWLEAQIFSSSDLMDLRKNYHYYPGWHYYLNLNDAKTRAYGSNSVVVKVLVKEIICTGYDDTGKDSGVSVWMRIEKIVYDASIEHKKQIQTELKREQKEERDTLIKSDSKFSKFLLNLPTDGSEPTLKHIDKLSKLLLTVDDMIELINLLDKLSRNANRRFVFMHRVHVGLLGNRFNHNFSIKYRQLYYPAHRQLTGPIPKVNVLVAK